MNITHYLDYNAIAYDLSMDYSETKMNAKEYLFNGMENKQKYRISQLILKKGADNDLAIDYYEGCGNILKKINSLVPKHLFFAVLDVAANTIH